MTLAEELCRFSLTTGPCRSFGNDHIQPEGLTPPVFCPSPTRAQTLVYQNIRTLLCYLFPYCLLPLLDLFTMVALTAVMAFSAILALTSADGGAGRKDKGHLKVTPNSTLRSRDLFRRQCEGTCEECFGSGYTLCPGSSYYCYLPGDSLYGLDSCSTDTSSAPEPTSTGSAGDSDFCSGASATCVSCFGEGYLDCPDNYHWYVTTG